MPYGDIPCLSWMRIAKDLVIRTGYSSNSGVFCQPLQVSVHLPLGERQKESRKQRSVNVQGSFYHARFVRSRSCRLGVFRGFGPSIVFIFVSRGLPLRHPGELLRISRALFVLNLEIWVIYPRFINPIDGLSEFFYAF